MAEVHALPSSEDVETSDQQKSLTAHVIALCKVHTEILQMLSERLPEAATVVEDSTLDLTERFKVLAQGAQSQAEQMDNIIATASTLSIEGEDVSLNDFMDLFNNTLTDSIQQILNISKMAMSMVYSLNDAIEALGDIESFVGEIQKINKQTNLLALNATIEAERAGEAGKGFVVVASEVKTISHRITSLSIAMNDKIGLVSDSVRDGYKTLQEVATADMSENIMAKEKLDELMQALINQNDNFTKIMEESSASSREIYNNIGQMVVGMQFQDKTTQIIENTTLLMQSMIENCEQLSADMYSGSTPTSTVQLQAQFMAEPVLAKLKLSDFRQDLTNRLINASLMDKGIHSIEDSSEEEKENEIELF